mmetsp:Transcript_6043/g.22115  ORF Transcript_6043/g.22115 Transcript_6043/m.22115 type:complete len:278 (+) Transcript_6043:22-855(+)
MVTTHCLTRGVRAGAQVPCSWSTTCEPYSAAHRRLRIRPGSQRRRWYTVAAADSGNSDFEDELEKATREAAEIHLKSAELAQQQTRRELELATETDKIDESLAEPSRGRSEDQIVQWSQETCTAVEEELHSYWISAGLRTTTAEALARSMVRTRSPYAMDLTLLHAKVERLQRTLPDSDVPKLLAAYPGLLTTEISAVVTSCIYLTTNFDPTSIPTMIEDAPQLLTLADQLNHRITKTLHAVQCLFPKASMDDIKSAIAEEPTLLLKIPEQVCVLVG